MRRTFRPWYLAASLPAWPFLAGCGAESWTPPAPAGVTWQYDYQGFTERKTNVVAGAVGGPYGGMAYGGAFSFRHESELHASATADPFAESAPIDGIRFNEHLGNQGTRLAPPQPPQPAAPAGSNVPPLPAPSPGSSW